MTLNLSIARFKCITSSATVWCLTICLSHFYPRDAMLARDAGICYGIFVCLSVCLCVTSVLCIKTAKHFVKILLPPYSPIILVFRHRGSLLNSDGFTPNGGAEYKGR